MPITSDNLNSYHYALEADDASSFVDETVDFFQYGITSALLSGGIGFVNTGVAFANMFGSETERFSTYDTLRNVGWDDTANYYSEHKDAIDTVGFVASSLVPGMLGLKAAKLAQGAASSAAASNSASGLTIGIRNMLVPKGQVDKLTRAIKTESLATPNITNRVLRASKEGFHQAAVESAFVESAILLSANQNPVLNQENMDYFDSVKNNLGGAGFGFVLGTGVGGTIYTAITARTMQKIGGDEWLKTNQMIGTGNIDSEYMQLAFNRGDKISKLLQERKNLLDTVEGIDTGAVAGTTPQRDQIRRGLDQLEVEVENEILGMVDAFEGSGVDAAGVAAAFKNQILNMDVIDATDLMANLNRITDFSDAGTLSVFDPVISKMDIVAEDDWIDAAGRKILGEDYDSTNTAMRSAVSDRVKDANGLHIGDGTKRGDVHILETLLEEGNEKAARGVMFHEMGHANTTRLGKILDSNPFNVTMQMESLSRMHRPVQWRQVDQLPQLRNKLQQKIKEGTSIGELDDLSTYIRQMEDQQKYLNDPLELMADSWAVLNTRSTFHEAVKKAPDTYQFFAGNAAVKQRVGTTEALADLKDGSMFSVPDRVPTIADLGSVQYNQRAGVVSFGNGPTRGSVTIKSKFNILETTPQEASAHYYAASRSTKILPKEIETDWTDFAKLNQILERHRNGKWEGTVKVKVDDTVRTIEVPADNGAEFRQLYSELKQRAVHQIRNAEETRSTPSQLARIVDTSEEYALNNGRTGGTEFWSEAYPVKDPTIIKLQYKTRADAADPATMRSMADVDASIQAVRESTKASVVSFFQSLDNGLPDLFPPTAWESGTNIAQTATPQFQGQGFVRTIQGEYGSIESFAQAVAEGNSRAKGKWSQLINDNLTTKAQRVINNEQALNEAAVLDSILRREKFIFAPTGTDNTQGVTNYAISLRQDGVGEDVVARNIAKLQQAFAQVAEGVGTGTIWGNKLTDAMQAAVNSKRLTAQQIEAVIQGAQKSMHQIKSPELREMWRTKVTLNAKIVEGKRTVAGVRGLDTSLRDDILYPGPFNDELYPITKFVYPKKGSALYSDGKPSIISASTPDGILQKEAQLRQAFGDDFILRTKEDLERNFQMRGQFDQELALNDYHVDSTMLNKGILSDVIPEPSPELIRNYVRHMTREADGIVDNLTAAQYSDEFSTLDYYGKLEKANNTGLGKKANTPTVYDKTTNIMLNRETKNQFEGWKTAQQKVDQVVSQAFDNIRGVFGSAKETVDYENLGKIMEDYGMPSPFDHRTTDYMRTVHKVPTKTLKEIVPKVNGLASNLMLRLDAIQWMVNAFSLPVTAVPELNHLIKSLPELQRQQVAASLSTAIPESVNAARMPSNSKLMMQAVKDFWTRKDLVQRYDELGLMPSIVREIRDSVDDIIPNPATLTKDGEVSKWKQGFEKTKELMFKPSDYSESFVKFVAARVADLTLDAAGITNMSIKKQAMLTYAKRVHGNYTYAQRPALFQGFAGQAIGLFQTYQFNLFQQLLRHVGDKNLTATTNMLGLQAGIFGVQGVPGFQLLNNYIGEKSLEGNDFYTGAQELFGNEVSEWMLYGLSSNFTKPIFGNGLALYTRGDLTPRTPILIPTSLSDVPAVSLTTKFVNNLGNVVSNLGQGVPVDTVFYEALAQNGVNRPLAGLGQLLSGARTTTRGTILAATQDMDMWQRAARIMGSKDLNEAIAVNAFYRAKAYDTSRREHINELGKNAKAMIRSGEWDNESYMKFFENYSQAGGRQDYFRQWLHNQVMGATESTIQNIYKANNTPSGKYLQKILGGEIEQYIDTSFQAPPAQPVVDPQTGR